mmetsp:Transcript_11390/g.27541  ORF Transcript_11390/g.27541 Transcript_11390/m.27541 type:complete len:204 (-) Transcript_11390:132-743(-)
MAVGGCGAGHETPLTTAEGHRECIAKERVLVRPLQCADGISGFERGVRRHVVAALVRRHHLFFSLMVMVFFTPPHARLWGGRPCHGAPPFVCGLLCCSFLIDGRRGRRGPRGGCLRPHTAIELICVHVGPFPDCVFPGASGQRLVSVNAVEGGEEGADREGGELRVVLDVVRCHRRHAVVTVVVHIVLFVLRLPPSGRLLQDA